ncbi:MAG: T9SS type A sorting domain-containing protein [Chitinophagaceae bacterium]|nr:T9SS type A sorting domain-containing protein [Chitinophagaceae bacterium]
MRKLCLLLPALISALVSIAQTAPVLPLDFESGTINYSFTNFNGGATTKIANSQSSGINTSANVGKMIKSADQVWGGSWISLAAPIDFSVNKSFKVKVFMPRVGAKLLLKVENQSNATANFEKEATGTIANAWEELTFDYSTINTSNQYQKLVLIFDLGTMGDGSANFTYLFDDITLTTAGGGGGSGGLTQMNLPVNFDTATVNYGLVGFGGAEASTIVADPSLPGNNVAKVIKSATAELWAGTTITAITGGIQTGFSSRIPFTATQKKMKVRVWSPNAGIKIRLKVEDHLDPTKSVETEATSTIANDWETLTFDFANQAAGTAAFNLAFNYDKASIFFNFGITGAVAGEKIYYFDDVQFGGTVIPPPSGSAPVLPLDFESGTIDYSFTNFNGGGTTKIANPQSNGINTSANVGKMIKSADQVWGGSWISLAAPIDFSVNKTFKVKVFMPRVGAKLLLKVENQSNATANFEKEATGTIANAWEELTFDYSTINTSNQYQKLVLIFDLGTMGDGSANFTYLFDDITLTTGGGGGGSSTQMNLPVSFDGAIINYGLVGFGGAEASTFVADTSLPSNQVAKVIKSATAELWAGTSITAVTAGIQTGFGSRIPFTATEKRMNVRVWSPNAGIKIRLKVEDHLDPTKSVETEATSTVANAWETLTFDFGNQATGTAAINLGYNYNKTSIFFNFGVTGAVAGEKTYYFDDIQFGAAVLPVKMTSFKAVVANNNAQIKWTTENEINNSHYEIERSNDAVHFTTKGRVNGSGTSSLSRSYSFTDPLSAAPAIVYYRLKIVDIDGRFSYSTIVALRTNGLLGTGNFSVYPNPFVTHIKVSLSSPEAAVVGFRMLSLEGKEILNRKVALQQGDNVVVLKDFGVLPKGNYVLEVTNASGKLTRTIMSN